MLLAFGVWFFTTSPTAFAIGLDSELIVKYRSGGRVASTGASSVDRLSGPLRDFEILRFDSAHEAEDARVRLAKDSAVEYVERNQVVVTGEQSAGEPERLCFIPGIQFFCFYDPLKAHTPEKTRPEVLPVTHFGLPNGRKDPGRDKLYGLKYIRARSAWSRVRNSAPVVVAVLDSGADYNHEDLAPNLWRNPEPGPDQGAVGYDFVHDDHLPYDDFGHGTHVAGIIGAVGSNGIGVTGVSPQVSLMILKFLPSTGIGTTANAIRAIDFAILHGARIINNSWGFLSVEENRALREAVERAHLWGVLFVASAGNNGIDTDGASGYLPAAFGSSNLISVAASNSADTLTTWSNYGAAKTHLAAPGNAIYSTLPGNAYGLKSGTSMAAPHVTGAAALLWAMHPQWSHLQIREAVLNAVDLIPALHGRVATGGRLNIRKAL